MSFHPLMMYDERFHKSERKLADEGPPMVATKRPAVCIGDFKLVYFSAQPRGLIVICQRSTNGNRLPQ